mmetsp:Transcript_2062/g.6539  ORF Transcript_2062/g.6539 Transcript_2062/m.6539 type:complete len:359 (-) Transcript_2062:1123-2199(-)
MRVVREQRVHVCVAVAKAGPCHLGSDKGSSSRSRCSPQRGRGHRTPADQRRRDSRQVVADELIAGAGQPTCKACEEVATPLPNEDGRDGEGDGDCRSVQHATPHEVQRRCQQVPRGDDELVRGGRCDLGQQACQIVGKLRAVRKDCNHAHRIGGAGCTGRQVERERVTLHLGRCKGQVSRVCVVVANRPVALGQPEARPVPLATVLRARTATLAVGGGVGACGGVGSAERLGQRFVGQASRARPPHDDCGHCLVQQEGKHVCGQAVERLVVEAQGGAEAQRDGSHTDKRGGDGSPGTSDRRKAAQQHPAESTGQVLLDSTGTVGKGGGEVTAVSRLVLVLVVACWSGGATRWRQRRLL